VSDCSPKANQDGWLNTHCPFHDDNKISFGFNKRNGKWKCHAGCGNGDPIDFYACRMDITRQDAIKMLSDELKISFKRRLVAKYLYRNGSGKTIYKKKRYEPKEFLFKTKTKTGWEFGLKDANRVPYNLNKILKSRAVYICEGEKDADNLVKLGVTATTLDSGSSSRWLQQYNNYFKNKTVAILPDNDRAGQEFARRIAIELYDTAKLVRIIQLPGLKHKQDVTDWINDGGTKKELIGIAKNTKNIDIDELRYELELSQKFIELNRKYAVINVRGCVKILKEIFNPDTGRKDIVFMKPIDLAIEEKPNTIFNPNTDRKENVVDKWLKSPFRREYKKGIVFDPNKTSTPGWYNLWRGFAYSPKKGKWGKFRWHIKNVIADGDKEIAKWIIAWMARIVQDPGGRRPGTAIVLQGGQGIGKGLFATYFGKLFGDHFLHITNPKQITGRFNHHLKDALVVFGDEVTWGGNVKDAGILKTLVTEDTNLCEPKYVDPFTVKNHINLIFASNSDWAMYTEKDERRFAVFEVPDKKRDQKSYFQNIAKQMDNGGLEAMLYDLLYLDYSDIDLTVIPKTSSLLDQKLRNMHPVHRYWYYRLKEGTIINPNVKYQNYEKVSRFANKEMINRYRKG
jgi:5S rRNA maturation endonuclease (ribonuclease M5)